MNLTKPRATSANATWLTICASGYKGDTPSERCFTEASPAIDLPMPEGIVATGAGGFIGGHLVAALLRQGNNVRAVDIKPFEESYQLFPEAENLQLDLCRKDACERAVRNISLVYNLAADMGGMGFIKNKRWSGPSIGFAPA
jgi:GDP-D-mannose 3', 5'-epimerase